MSKKNFILSIEGGGVKGLIPAYICKEIERRLIKQTNDPNSRLGHYFDLVAGTSAGSLLTALYLTPINGEQNQLPSAEQVYKRFRDEFCSVFYLTPQGRPAPNPDFMSEKLQQCAENFFGDHQLKDLAKPTLIPAYEPSRHWLAFFKQHAAARVPEENYYVRDVVRASCALPLHIHPAEIQSFSDRTLRTDSFKHVFTCEQKVSELFAALRKSGIIDDDHKFIAEISCERRISLKLPASLEKFEPVVFSILDRVKNPKFTFIDGAIFANNPSLCALMEIHNMPKSTGEIPSANNTVLVSIGTGIDQSYQSYSKEIGPQFASKLMTMLFDTAETLAHFETYYAFRAFNTQDNYFFLNPILRRDASVTYPNNSINDSSEKNLSALETVAENYIQQRSEEIDTIVTFLTKDDSST